MVTVFLVDDHEVVRLGIRELIEDTDDLTVVGEAATCAEARRRVPSLRPDVAVLDVRLPDGSGVQLCRDLLAAAPHLRCLMLTSFVDEESMVGAVLAGASGFLVKDIRGPELVAAVRAVAAGRSLLDDRATAVLMGKLREQAAPGPLSNLTDRERTVLAYLGQGLTNRQIARRMFLSEKTVKNYVSQLLSKLEVAGRTQAAVLAARLGLADLPER
ncbi:Transcriptional regulatory protein devR (dosR) [Nocardia otitidiscaviarum]|uniref:Transcriptional regulatory protein devR (DosR) n=1 Tax=Nocardia otitidiscaviarum TaxID=1823 RepID=A0A379JHJ2_9NOCA|nr:response regulator transcription factor [Nocardia otitidiscaviarum]MBF6177180.1 response regulator transcription factor [Nocardia otitidiscaviarum]SUD48012.1 Transcriptional regulatory protein devR (dosR) [Nocardia otitidiscaviarum]